MDKATLTTHIGDGCIPFALNTFDEAYRYVYWARFTSTWISVVVCKNIINLKELKLIQILFSIG